MLQNQDTNAKSVRQYLLSPVRQVGLFGTVDPILDEVSVEAINVETPRIDKTTEEKREQKELPLFSVVNQLKLKFPEASPKHLEGECSTGFFARVCQHTEHEHFVAGKMYCGRQDCEPSSNRNSSRRFDKLFYGDKESLSEETGELKKLGISKLVENFDTIWFVFTVPDHLHILLFSTDYLNRMHRAAYKVVRKMLEANGIPDDGKTLVPIKGYFHPNGDKDGDKFKPHLNYGVVNCFYRDGRLIGGKRYFSKKWFEEETFRDLYLEELNKEFGFNIWEGYDKKPLNFFVEIRKKEEVQKVMHSWSYFSRVFPNFTRLHNGRRFLPKSLSLLAPKNVSKLKEVLDKLPETSRSVPNCGKGTVEEPCSFIVLAAKSEEELKKSLLRFKGASASPSILKIGQLKPVYQGLEPPD